MLSGSGNVDGYENMPRQQLENVIATLPAHMPKPTQRHKNVQLRLSKDHKTYTYTCPKT